MAEPCHQNGRKLNYMSRIGKKLIAIPNGVTVNATATEVSAKGPKGSLNLPLHPHIKVLTEDNNLKIEVKDPELQQDRALWGLYRALIANLVRGVNEGFEKKLEINGVGYRASVAGKKLVLALGFSHPVELEIPEGLNVVVEKNLVTISGIDKQSVGQFAAIVRSQKTPEPYKGKGIKYIDEVVRRKAGKAAKAVGGE